MHLALYLIADSLEAKLSQLVSSTNPIFSIVFNCGATRFYFSYDIEFLSIAEDVIILKLQQVQHQVKPLKLCTDAHIAFNLFDIFGFPDDNSIKADVECIQQTNIVDFAKESESYFRKHKKSVCGFKAKDFNLKGKCSKLYFHCSVDMSYGASGSPGVVYRRNGDVIYPEVICMLKKGHPGYYYQNYTATKMKSKEHQKHLPYLIEEGLSMNGLSALLHKRKEANIHKRLRGETDLCDSLFAVEDPQSTYLCKGRFNLIFFTTQPLLQNC